MLLELPLSDIHVGMIYAIADTAGEKSGVPDVSR
jgi:hypothetical protein